MTVGNLQLEHEFVLWKNMYFEDIRIVAALASVNMIVGMYRGFGT